MNKDFIQTKKIKKPKGTTSFTLDNINKIGGKPPKSKEPKALQLIDCLTSMWAARFASLGTQKNIEIGRDRQHTLHIMKDGSNTLILQGGGQLGSIRAS